MQTAVSAAVAVGIVRHTLGLACCCAAAVAVVAHTRWCLARLVRHRRPPHCPVQNSLTTGQSEKGNLQCPVAVAVVAGAVADMSASPRRHLPDHAQGRARVRTVRFAALPGTQACAVRERVGTTMWAWPLLAGCRDRVGVREPNRVDQMCCRIRVAGKEVWVQALDRAVSRIQSPWRQETVYQGPTSVMRTCGCWTDT